MTTAFTPVIAVHATAAVAALAVGAAVFLRPKGTFAHKVLGRGWVLLMLVTAISTYWIRGNGSFSWIHGLSVFVVVGLAAGVTYAIRGKLAAHQRMMKGLYVGGLVIAGGFALMPQRLLGHALWSALGLV